MNAFSRLLSLAALLGLIACNHAAKPDLVDASRLHDPLSKAVTTTTLPNGLDVVFIEQHQAPIATVLIAVRAGAMVEPPDLNGLSHLYEHMFFKGNDTLPTQELYMKRVHELGMVFNGTTSTESVRYHFTLPKENIEAGLAFMRDAMLTPKFEQSELERERKVVLAEFDRAESGPDFPFYREIITALFPEHPERKITIGDRTVIATATREKMQFIKDHYYVPNNSALIVSGDIDPRALLPVVTQLFSVWPKAADPFVANPIPELKPLAASKKIVFERDYQNVRQEYTWQGPSLGKDNPDVYAATVLAYLYNQRSSGFSKRLLDSGLWDDVTVDFDALRHTGAFSVGGVTAPERATEAMAAMEREIARLGQAADYSDEELNNAKVNLAVSSLYSFQGSQDVAREVAYWWCSADLAFRLTLLDHIKQVSRADLDRFVARYLRGKPNVEAVMLSPANRLRLFGVAPAEAATLGK